MGDKLDKFLLLMWKNWLLQYRRPVQTLVEIVVPVLFSLLLVVIRRLVDPELHEAVIFKPFCTIPMYDSASVLNMMCNPGNTLELEQLNLHSFRVLSQMGGRSSNSSLGMDFGNFSLVYSPRSEALEKAMNIFKLAFGEVVEIEDSNALNDYFQLNATNMTFAGIEFDDSYKGVTNLSTIKNFKVSIRFPGETRLQLDEFRINNWRTNLIFPVFQTPGPRQYVLTTGAAPSYYGEGFLAVQHFLTLSLILARKGISLEENPFWLLENTPPVISMRRYPYPEWSEDILLTPLKSMLGIIMMLSFVYTCINTVKSITTEKEKQLKESMKIMGLPNWLHWTAWFMKSFIFLFISAVLIVILLKVKWYPNTDYTVFTYADPSVMLFFFFFYICSIITFCFAISVFFSKANTAATIAGLAWFVSYAPYLFMQQTYDSLSLSSKLFASLGSNSAMAFGFQVMLMYEGTGEGVQWSNIFTPNNPDDKLTLGLILIMLTVDTFIYLIIALYVEAVFPGDYGVPQPWYFLFTSSFWCGPSSLTRVEDLSAKVNEGEFFEEEPRHLRVGIEIKNLRKVFNNKAAVQRLSVNMFEDQITVLLGHNGAGKTTTMSMLTGMITPTSGTAKVNGYDIRTDMGGVRSSLGLCPQHNIIFDELTVAEHLYFFSKLKGLQRKYIPDEINKYVQLLELEDKRNAKSATLSGGMKRKLCVGMALCGNSKVVMLDEPTAGMDPSARRALWDLLQNQKEGRTMLLTTHFMDEADLLGDRIAIMAGGELQCCGSSFFLKKKYGAGYSLILDKSRDCEPSEVTQLLQNHIPGIEIHSNIGSELTYLLSESQSSQFEPMLKDLEEHSERLEIRSYGISLTTLEEVFMKVGADRGMENGDFDNPETAILQNGNISANGRATSGDTKINVGTHPSYEDGLKLLINQFLAMLMKKFLSTFRSWILLIIQIMMPVLFLIIAMVVARNQKRTGDLPALGIDLTRFKNPVTVVEDNPNSTYTKTYLDILKDLSYDFEVIDNITDRMLSLTAEASVRVRLNYIVGASFGDIETGGTKIPHITAWFNNDPYHSPAISLSLALNAMFRQMLECDDCSIKFTNHPMPYTAEVQVKQLLSGQSMGFQLAFNLGFSMAFVSSFYVLFVVRENVSKSKHLQFVSGAKVLVFWLTSALCDMFTYLVTIAAVLITLTCFQENGFKTVEDIGRMFLIFFYFGWAFLPMLYIAGYFFDVPSTGYTRMTMFSTFTGVTAFLVVQVLSSPGFNLEHIGRALHWAFLVLPHYSLATGINNCFMFYSYKRLCTQCINGICSNSTSYFTNICKGVEESYYRWDPPGIGRNLMFSFVGGIVLFLVLLCVEFELFSRIIYYVSQKYFPKKPIELAEEDSDVAEEKQRIRNAPQQELLNNYTLILRDLTKYYKNFLAVNSLCLGVQEYECFGLLGVNGAGKTTTFKMMTGDVRITYGDGWVNGFSIKNQIKRVQKSIGYCPQFDALLDDMTARETITMFALLRGIRYSDCKALAETLAREFDFLRHLDKKVKELSGGNKRKLSTSISLIGDPPVIYLDEPTTGMDPATKRYLWNALCKIRDSGKCVVLTSHSMEECEALCTRLAIMVNGQFKCLGSTQHLKNKFAEGYTITIKLRKLEDDTHQQYETGPVEQFIQAHFDGAKLREKHQELLNYYVTSKSIPWSQMFGILERAKRADLNIEDYSLGQSSLEQVFLTFTRQQH
ncbi:ATP-binding cassette sub-family A member 3-like isoform X2 [Anoplophora glabripennis]|nr:ATP-binding cassette sub-family A member 3-like isoform X2 [Anoplophora glabripennis]